MNTFILLSAGSGFIAKLMAPTYEAALEFVYNSYSKKISRSSLRECLITLDEAKDVGYWHEQWDLATKEQPEFDF